MTRRAGAVNLAAMLLLAAPLAAQSSDSARRDTASRVVAADDSIYLRARRLVLEGNGAAGRAIVDSLVTVSAGTASYANALYWRAALASTAVDAERDYRRVIVEFPFSPHAGDALLALAQLEMARGDRASAADHLQRFLLQRPNDAERVRAGIWLGRLLLEVNQIPKGCAVLLRTRASLGADAVEIRNQVDYYAARCAGVDTTPPPPAVAPTPPRRSTEPRSTPRDTARAPSRDTARPSSATRQDTARRVATPRPADTLRRTPPPAAAPESAPPAARPPVSAPTAVTGRYTVQVAAYDTRTAAQQLVDRLAARGIVARIAGGTAPFRVRVGTYATEAEAAAAARDLKAKGITVFVTTTDVERSTAPGPR